MTNPLTQPHARFTGAPALHPQAQPARVVEMPRPALARVVPTVTVYAEGLVNLNTEASAFFGPGVCLQAPPEVRPGRTPQPWQISAGTCHALLPVSREKPAGSMRFRAPVAQCPPVGRYLLAPVVGQPTRFLLVPG